MATTAVPQTDRPHRAKKRYIYAWGEGTAEGNGGMKDLLGGKGSGLAEMTIAGLPDASRVHDHDRGLQRLLRRRRAAPGRALGRRPGGDARGRAAVRQGLRRPGQPAPRERPLRSEVLDARDDGHGPEPRPERGDAPGAHRAHRQRAVRLGRLPAVHPDVRPDRDGREGRAVRPRPRGTQGRDQRGRPGHGPDGRRPEGAGRGVQGDRPRGHGRGLPDRPERPARQGDQGRLRQLVRQAGPRLPSEPKDRGRPRDRGQRRLDGLRQHGRRLRAPASRSPAIRTRASAPCSASTSRTPRARTSSPASGRRRRSPRWRPTCRPSTTSSSRSASSSRSTTATSRTSSSRSRRAVSSCSRRGPPSGPPRPPSGSRSTWSTRARSRRRRRSPGSSRPTSSSSSGRRSTRPRSRAP